MWSTAYRDAGIVESLGAIMDDTWFALLDQAVELLAAGRGLRGRRRERVLGALRLAVDFPTWRTLTSSGLGDDDAASIAATFVEAAAAQAGEPSEVTLELRPKSGGGRPARKLTLRG